MNCRDVTIITLWDWEKIRINKTYEEYIQLKQWQQTINIASLRREINIKDIKSARWVVEYLEPMKQLGPPVKKELTKQDITNKKKIIAEVKKIRDKKKQEIEKEQIEQPIEQKLSHLWSSLDMWGDREKELLNNLNK